MIPTTLFKIIIGVLAVPLYFIVVPALAIFIHTRRWDDEHPRAGFASKVAHTYDRYAYTDQDYRSAQILYVASVLLLLVFLVIVDKISAQARRAVCFVLCCGWCCCARSRSAEVVATEVAV